MDEHEFLGTVTKVANALRGEGIPFALAGGSAVYARGGPVSDHDVDVLVIERDAGRARDALVGAGMRGFDPPEDWLTKAYDGNCLVDVIFRPNQRPVTRELLGRAEWMRVGPTMAPVLSATDLLTDKLLVLGQHRCDFTPLLPIVRLLREQVDWPEVRARTVDSPYARAFLHLAADLDLVEGADVTA